MEQVYENDKTIWFTDDVTKQVNEELHYPSSGHAPAQPCPNWSLYLLRFKDEDNREEYYFYNKKLCKLGLSAKDYMDAGNKAYLMRLITRDDRR